MPDLLCPLVDLPPIRPVLEQLEKESIFIRRANSYELTKVREFVEKHFTTTWADETTVAFSRLPITCFIATKDKEVIGFADYECTRRGYFGPTGVDDSFRGKGVGKALLLAALYGLQELGYTYGVIGGAGPVDFYKKTVGAIEIPFDEGRGIYHLDKEPGLYR